MADESRVVNAAPTKDFFINMLVRDIQLIPAVVDLVDNCVDGAKRSRADDDFSGLEVRLVVSEDEFRISDNCGGIPIEIARHYAFRFGRPDGMETTRHSIGQFGVGMKRALFKLGAWFEVSSTTTTESFVLKVDVAEWSSQSDWTFEFESIGGPAKRPDDVGTTITVRPLHDHVARDFGRQQFQTQLAEALASQHQSSMNSGLAISLNAVPLQVDLLSLLQSDALRPAFVELTLFEEHPPTVVVKIYAGLGDSDPQKAGWYVYCNGRLVLGADQTIVTGWGENAGVTIPKYHNQFARFRGFVFFDCDDAGKLPWTTTKTGVDSNAESFRSARQRMIALMRPVIDFLNALDREKDSPPDDVELLEEVISRTQPTRLNDVQPVDRFSMPTRTRVARPPDTQSIQYRKPKVQIEVAKRVLRVTSAGAVGERSFDYFFKRECEES